MSTNSILPLNCDTEDLIASTVDGNYTYVRYSNDGDAGTGFSSTYSPSTHNYVGIITSTSEIPNPSVSDFVGSWVEKQEQYTYFAFATDSLGSGFSTTYTGSETYYDIINSTVEIPSLSVSDFTGIWIPFAQQDAFTSKTFNEYVPTFFDTNELGRHTTSVVTSRTYQPSVYYYEGTYKRFYFMFFESAQPSSGDGTSSDRRTVANGYNAEYYNRSWVSYYDIETGAFGDPVALAETYNRPGDAPSANPTEEASPHNLPSITVDDDGYILIFKEDLDYSATPKNHNSHIEVWRSDAAENISSFTKQDELGDWGTEKAMSYPTIFKLSDGTICAIMRDKGGSGADGTERYIVICKSEDGGVTWTNMADASDTYTILAQLDTNKSGSGWRLYPIHASDKDGINLVLHSYDEGNDNASKDVYYLHSDDGVTWANAQSFTEGTGGYSKNVVTGGVITGAQLDANFLVDALTPTGSTSNMPISAGVDKNDVPYIFTMASDRSDDSHYNSVTNLYVYYWNTSSHVWTETDVLPNLTLSGNSNVNILSKFVGSIVPYETGVYDLYVAVLSRLEEDDFATTFMGDINFQSKDPLIKSGSLIPGLFYEIVAEDSVVFNNDSDLGVGDIFKENGNTTGEMTDLDHVREIIMRPYRFRTNDYGVSFQPFAMPNGNYKHGGAGALPRNVNCTIDDKLLLLWGVHETTLGAEVEYQNLIGWYSDLKR